MRDMKARSIFNVSVGKCRKRLSEEFPFAHGNRFDNLQLQTGCFKASLLQRLADIIY